MENLHKAIGLFIEEMRDFVVFKLNTLHKDNWSNLYYNCLNENNRTTWDNQLRAGANPKVLIDFGNLPDFAFQFKSDLKKEFKSDAGNLVTWFKELKDVRNKLQHFNFTITRETEEKSFLTMIQILDAIGEKETADTVRTLKMGKSTPAVEPKEIPKPKTEPSVIQKSASTLPPWFSVVVPHIDIRKGRLDESVFAANLMEVSQGNGREVYTNPGLFFEKTYPTAALKALIQRVAEGLSGGDSENRVISLQTGFGGGKTHSLISLYHVSRMPASARKQSSVSSFLVTPDGKFPDFEQAKVAVFTNTTNDPTQGRTTDDGVHIHTLWGEISYQLGGISLYEKIRENDISRVSPKGLFKGILESAKPALILLDELADYCMTASGVRVGDSNLSDQTISFLQELTQAVAEVPGAVLVATLPASNSEMGNSESSAKILSSLESRIKRVGADQKPVDDNEIYEVIRRRLFENFDDPKVKEALETVCNSYIQYYFQNTNELPTKVPRTEYSTLLKKSYPFHPELILCFQHKWGSHNGFQRTRGVLRILANLISDLWKRKETLTGSQSLIHPSDIRFENLNSLSSELRRLWGDGYESVILADVSNVNSHSYRMDSEHIEYGSHNISKGIASSILMNSFGSDGANRGLNIKEIKLALLRPDGFNHNLIHGSLDKLISVSHYLYYTSDDSENKRYWYHTKPNINILITEAKSQIQSDLVRMEIVRRLQEKTKSFSKTFKVLIHPESDVAEQKNLAIIFLSPEYRGNPEKLTQVTESKIKKMFLKRGQGDRLYRNTILFCIASELGISKLEESMRDFLACRKTESDYGFQLESEQKEEIKRKMEEFSNRIDANLQSCYSLVVKPGSKNENLIFSIPQVNNSGWEAGIVSLLEEEGILIGSLGMKLLQDHSLFPTSEKAISSKDLYEAFLRYDDKPMITGFQAVIKTIERYTSSGDLCIATKTEAGFTNFRMGAGVKIGEILDESLYLLHPTAFPKPVREEAKSENFQNNLFPGPIPIKNTEKVSPIDSLPPDPPLKSVEVSGRVSITQYTQIFSAFIQQLKDNNIEIQVKIKGTSTPSHPILRSSTNFKIVQESARQLGFDLQIEE